MASRITLMLQNPELKGSVDKFWSVPDRQKLVYMWVSGNSNVKFWGENEKVLCHTFTLF